MRAGTATAATASVTARARPARSAASASLPGTRRCARAAAAAAARPRRPRRSRLRITAGSPRRSPWGTRRPGWACRRRPACRRSEERGAAQGPGTLARQVAARRASSRRCFPSVQGPQQVVFAGRVQVLQGLQQARRVCARREPVAGAQVRDPHTGAATGLRRQMLY